MIEHYITKLNSNNAAYLLCYFDLDNFKAFNDVYGFRNGDRMLQLFADLLIKKFDSEVFKAHIGGGDFFCAFKENHEVNVEHYINNILYFVNSFTNSAKEFYSNEDKNNGYITTKDRDGNIKQFPLITASVSSLIIPKSLNNISGESINHILSSQKK